MNTKSVITKKSFYEELTRKNIDITELYSLISKDFTGKIKVIIHTPTTAGISSHIAFEDNFTLSKTSDLIKLEGTNTNTVFCITDLTSVHYEKMQGRPNLSIEKMHTELWFIWSLAPGQKAPGKIGGLNIWDI